MVYMPPFSESGLAVGSLKSLAHFQDYYKQWRGDAIAGYSAQLGIMERLRHELLLLHSKVKMYNNSCANNYDNQIIHCVGSRDVAKCSVLTSCSYISDH